MSPLYSSSQSETDIVDDFTVPVPALSSRLGRIFFPVIALVLMCGLSGMVGKCFQSAILYVILGTPDSL